jgi:hypothetical protein
VKNLREGLAVPYEVYEEIEPRCVGCGEVREQVRFRFTITMFYYSFIKQGDARGLPKRASTRGSGSNIARGTSRLT